MTVVRHYTDEESLTINFVADFAASIDRVWALWENPRLLEKWWGPPTWPATFEQHEFAVGGKSRYYMTGPDGDKSRGWWQITVLEPPHRIEFKDGFSDEDGEPADWTPAFTMSASFEEIEGGTRMTLYSRFVDLDQLRQISEMGMEEGMHQAMGQMDAVLADSAEA